MTTVAIVVVLAPVVIAFLVAGGRRPTRLLLPVYAALIPYGSGVALPIGLPTSYTSLSTLTGFALIIALVAHLLCGGRTTRNVSSSVPVWLMLLALCALSAAWSVDPGETLVTTVMLGAVLGMFVLLALTEIDPETVATTETAAVVGGVVASCYGLLQVVTGTLPGADHDSPEATARFGNDLIGDNHVAAALAIPLAIALTRTATRATAAGRLLHGVATLLLVTGIVLTGSRTGLVAAAVVLVIVVLNVDRRALLVGMGTVVAAAVVAVLVFNPGGVGGRQASAEDNGRSDIAHVGLHACQAHCGIGSGWATFPEVYERTQAFVPEAEVLPRGTRYVPHNNWLMLVVETGIVGVLLFTVGLGLVARDALRLPRRSRAAPLAAVAAVIFSGYTLSNFEFKYFWFALIYVVLVRNACEHEAGAERRHVRAAELLIGGRGERHGDG